MKDSKNLVIGMLCAVVCVMAVAYAAFSTTLNINGTATVASNWKVEILSIECDATEAAGGATSINEGAIELKAEGEKKGETTAEFTMTFLQPGDTAECIVTVQNAGSLPAKLAAPVDGQYWTETNADSVITFAVEGATEGRTLAAGAKDNVFTITAEYDDVDTQPDSSKLTNSLVLTLPYVQA